MIKIKDDTVIFTGNTKIKELTNIYDNDVTNKVISTNRDNKKYLLSNCAIKSIQIKETDEETRFILTFVTVTGNTITTSFATLQELTNLTQIYMYAKTEDLQSYENKTFAECILNICQYALTLYAQKKPKTKRKKTTNKKAVTKKEE